ncbi:MAG: hypothetical protein JRJ84_14520, partial [Deltaproteobacteria bacterium]|nr:hypothetical protein [Deltaproteobacteria bacterium]
MISPARMFIEGGPILYGLLGAGVFTAIATLVLAVPALLRVRIPAAVWLFLPCGVVVGGAYGTVSAVRVAMDALAATASEQTALLAAQGYAMALYPWLFALGVAAVLLVLVAWLAAIAHLIGAGKKATNTFAHAALPLLLGVMALAVGVGLSAKGTPPEHSWLLGGVAVVGAFAVSVVSVRS